MRTDEAKRCGRKPKVDIYNLPFTDDCIDHQQKGNADGYGHRGKDTLHRLVYSVCVSSDLPPVVMHTCDNPRCINPRHLVAGDRDLNNKDRAKKGRSAKSRIAFRKISAIQAEEIRGRYSPKRCKVNGVSALSREYRVDTQTIYNIVKNRTHFA